MRYYLFGLLNILFLLSSCQDNRKEQITKLVMEWQGKEILFPDGMVFTRYLTDTVDYRIPRSDHKILIYVDSIGCTSCKLQLDKWKEFIAYTDSVTKKTTPFVFVFQTNDLKEINHLMKRDRFDLPVYIDTDERMNQLNRFPSVSSFQTFLLDRENKVRIIGNPVQNLSIKELYLQALTGEVTSEDEQLLTRVAVKTDQIHLGSFPEEEVQKAVFTFKNMGEHPLVIIDASISCGCGKVSFEKRPAQPGDTLQLEVTMTPHGKGFFDETVTVRCNTENVVKLNITGRAT